MLKKHNLFCKTQVDMHKARCYFTIVADIPRFIEERICFQMYNAVSEYDDLICIFLRIGASATAFSFYLWEMPFRTYIDNRGFLVHTIP